MQQTEVGTEPSVSVMRDAQEEFRETMESRWRYAVFPTILTVVLLIGFMFYLIFGILQRMEDLSRDIHKMTNVITESLPVMQGGVVAMSSRMQWVGDDLRTMTADVNQMSGVLTDNMPAMTRSIDVMTADVSNMTLAANSMSATTHNMGQNIWDMNRNISGGPFGMMKDFIPFSKKSAPPPNPYYGYAQPSWYTMAPQPTVIAPAASAGSSSQETASPAKALSESGQSKFSGYCASCHGIGGAGGVGPSLKAYSPEQVVAVLQKYRTGELKGTMTGVAKAMSDDDIQTVAAYVGASL